MAQQREQADELTLVNTETVPLVQAPLCDTLIGAIELDE